MLQKHVPASWPDDLPWLGAQQASYNPEGQGACQVVHGQVLVPQKTIESEETFAGHSLNKLSKFWKLNWPILGNQSLS